jgi:hypothetical protein
MFTTKVDAAPVLFDRIDNISAYSGVTDGQTVPAGTGYPWGSNGYARPDVIKMERTSGNQRGISTACYTAAAADGDQAFMDGLYTGTSAPPVLLVSWWFWTSTIIPYEDHSSKYIRCSDIADQVLYTFSWTQRQDYVYQSPSECNFNNISDFCNIYSSYYVPSINTWHHFELEFNNIEKTYTLRCDNVLESSQSYSPGTLNFNQVWKIGWDGGGEPLVVPIDLRMDDIYVDTTYNRIFLGNSSTFNECDHTELQTITAWSTTSATVTLNIGSFASNASVYLFVVDSLNVPSAGYPITLGSGSSATNLQWVGGTSNDPSVASNYNPAQTPTSLDTVTINTGSSNMTINNNLTVAVFRQTSGYTGTITVNDTITANYLGLATCAANFYSRCIIKDSVVYASASTPLGYTGSGIVSVAGSTLRVKLNGNVGTPRVIMTPGSKIKW